MTRGSAPSNAALAEVAAGRLAQAPCLPQARLSPVTSPLSHPLWQWQWQWQLALARGLLPRDARQRQGAELSPWPGEEVRFQSHAGSRSRGYPGQPAGLDPGRARRVVSKFVLEPAVRAAQFSSRPRGRGALRAAPSARRNPLKYSEGIHREAGRRGVQSRKSLCLPVQLFRRQRGRMRNSQPAIPTPTSSKAARIQGIRAASAARTPAASRLVTTPELRSSSHHNACP